MYVVIVYVQGRRYKGGRGGSSPSTLKVGGRAPPTTKLHQDWLTNILLVRLAYSYSIVLIVLIMFVLKALINLYVRSEY